MNEEPRNPKKSWISTCFTVFISIFLLLALLMMLPIFFPCLMHHGGSQKTMCLSNLKQIGIGINMYLQDYDGKLPWATFGYTPTSNPTSPKPYPGKALADPEATFKEALLGYVKNDRIFICPASDEGYVYNSFTKASPDGQPSKWVAGTNPKNCPDPTLAALAWDSKPDPKYQAHDDSLNVLYMDYHASSVTPSAPYKDWWDEKSFEGWCKPAYMK